MTESNTKTSLRLKDVQKKNVKSKVMYIRTSLEKSKWMTKNSVSPSMILDKALDQLMESQDE